MGRLLEFRSELGNICSLFRILAVFTLAGIELQIELGLFLIVTTRCNISCDYLVSKFMNNKTPYYPTSLCRVQITPKTSTNITRYLYSRGPVRQVFSQRASNEFDSSYEKKICLSIGISFLRFFLTEILK